MTYRTPLFPLALFAAFAALAGCDNSDAPAEVAGSTALNSVDSSSGTLRTSNLTDDELAALEARTTISSNFNTPTNTGSFAATLSPVFERSFRDAQGNGYAFEATRIGAAIGAQAGVLPGTQVGPLPVSGMAAMSGPWSVVEIGKTNGEGREWGEAVVHEGRITLRADFDFGTLEGDGGDLRVIGRFDGSPVLTGDVFFQDRRGRLTGRVGTDRAIGAFHGADGDTAMSGGFYVSP